MSDEQRKALYDAIDYDENADAVTVDIPGEWVKMQVTMHLNKGVYYQAQQDNYFRRNCFEGCKTQFYERPDSFLASFQMEEFRIEDNTDTSLYKHIVSVKQDEENHQGDSFEEPFCSYRLKTIHWIKKQTQFLLEN